MGYFQHPVDSTGSDEILLPLPGFELAGMPGKDIEVRDIEIVTGGYSSSDTPPAVPTGTKWIMTYCGSCDQYTQENLYGIMSSAYPFAEAELSIDYLIKFSCGTGYVRDYVYTAYFVHFADTGNDRIDPEAFYLAGLTDNSGAALSLSPSELVNLNIFTDRDTVTIKYAAIKSPGELNEDLEIYYCNDYIRANAIKQDQGTWRGQNIYELQYLDQHGLWTEPDMESFNLIDGLRINPDANRLIHLTGATNTSYVGYSVPVVDFPWPEVFPASGDYAIFAPHAYKAAIYKSDAVENDKCV
jgi:hypothetical protein